ncbi:MAG: hypothetical protein O2968_22690 [Acidobacteria bacterium]|nr:hypothetical protein [Acidobacteriota bacterium]
MGIRNQRIDMGTAKYTRGVQDIKADEASGIETGYIEFQNRFLPVWRPLDGRVDEWGGRVDHWRPVYNVSLTTVPDKRTILAQRGTVEVDGRPYCLPLASLEITNDLKRHLAQAKPAT